MSRTERQMRILTAALWAGLALPAAGAPALDLTFPGPAETTARQSAALTSVRLPIGPFAGGSLPTQLAEGALNQTAFRVTLAQPSTLALMQALSAQLATTGFEVLFECETDICGGYDFRYGTTVLPEPDMHIDLGDFRYLVAKRPVAGKDEFVALLVSRSAQDGFVQVTQVGQSGVTVTASTKSASTQAANSKGLAAPGDEPAQSIPGLADLGKRLELGQAQVLEDLVFESGSSSLNKGQYVSLAALADWLNANPKRKVTLVGHTDASGGLAGNIRLSQLRAESVRQYLLFTHDVAPEQLVAEGVGYLAPRDSNQSEDGRRKNRRVEAMATSTELLAP